MKRAQMVSAAAVALFSGNLVMADVTPDEAWNSWQELSASSGATITTESVAMDGDTLVVTGLKSSADNELGKSETSLQELRFRDLGDGTVEITMSDEMSVNSTTPGIDGAGETATAGTVRMPGLVAIASGSPGEAIYDYTIPQIEMALTSKVGDAQPTLVTVTLTDAELNYIVAGPDGAQKFDGSFTGASAGMKVEDSSGGSNVAGSLSVADLSGKIFGNLAGLEDEDIYAAFAKGFEIDLDLSYGVTSYDFDVTDETGPGKITGGSEGGALGFYMNAARLAMGGTGKKVSVTISGAQLPVPQLNLSYAESGFKFLMPLSKSDQPQDFAFLAKLVDLSVSDEIWGMIDPSGALPRDPATVVIDTKGKARLTEDILNEAAMAALGEAPPGELLALDVTELRASIAGAALTVAGAFTFDNSDLVTYEGMPAPTGKLDLKLTGGNGLIDKLVGMGLISEDDAMGARMMMSMFANPGAGADELTSSLEFKDKHFYANGQQLQ